MARLVAVLAFLAIALPLPMTVQSTGAPPAAAPGGAPSARTPATPGAAPTSRTVPVLDVDGIIGPATADYVVRGLRRAAEEAAPLVVLRLDTPGGLDTAMRQIVKAILASPVPVATWVAPAGARAASAGAFVLYASHVAAMAPATNVGAATPVPVGGGPAPAPGRAPAPDDAPGRKGAAEARDDGRSKAVNDAAGYLKSLAQLRGRSVAFAERAVRDAASLPAQDALDQGVIDVVADDLPRLLAAIDGRTVQVGEARVPIAVAGAAAELRPPGTRHRVLAALSHPTLAVALLTLGFWALFVEFTSPGFGVPGVAGAVAVLLGLYGLQLLSVDWAGVGLIVLGLALMAAEAFLPSFGALGIGGVVAFVFGGLMLVDGGATGGAGVPVATLLMLAVLAAAAFAGVGLLALRTRRLAPAARGAALAGREGVVESVDADAWVRIDGELWRARVPDGAVPRPGQRVRVIRRVGLQVDVAADPPLLVDAPHAGPDAGPADPRKEPSR